MLLCEICCKSKLVPFKFVFILLVFLFSQVANNVHSKDWYLVGIGSAHNITETEVMFKYCKFGRSSICAVELDESGNSVSNYIFKP